MSFVRYCSTRVLEYPGLRAFLWFRRNVGPQDNNVGKRPPSSFIAGNAWGGVVSGVVPFVAKLVQSSLSSCAESDLKAATVKV
jgi:hypothetical protein